MAFAKPSAFADYANGRQLVPGEVFARPSATTRTDRLARLAVVPSNAPGFDFDPGTLSCRGVALAAAATNLNTFSANVESWNMQAPSVRESDTERSADGSLTASQVFLHGSAGGDMYKAFAVTPGLKYTFSVYHELLGPAFLALAANNTVGWNTVPGAVYSAGTPDSRGIARATLTCIAPANGLLNIHIGGSSNPDAPVQQPGRVRMSCIQLEQGHTATQYIPTAGSAVVRAADSLELPAAPSWFNPAEGTLFVEGAYDVLRDNGAQVVADICVDGNGRIALYREHTTGTMRVYFNNAAGGQGNVISSRTPVLRERFRCAVSYRASTGRIALACDGVPLQASVTPGAVTPYATRIILGDGNGHSETMRGVIARRAYWPQALSDADLQALVG